MFAVSLNRISQCAALVVLGFVHLTVLTLASYPNAALADSTTGGPNIDNLKKTLHPTLKEISNRLENPPAYKAVSVARASAPTPAYFAKTSTTKVCIVVVNDAPNSWGPLKSFPTKSEEDQALAAKLVIAHEFGHCILEKMEQAEKNQLMEKIEQHHGIGKQFYADTLSREFFSDLFAIHALGATEEAWKLMLGFRQNISKKYFINSHDTHPHLLREFENPVLSDAIQSLFKQQ